MSTNKNDLKKLADIWDEVADSEEQLPKNQQEEIDKIAREATGKTSRETAEDLRRRANS